MLLTWGLLFAAIGVEVASTAALPRTDGFHDVGWSLLTLSGYALSLWLLCSLRRPARRAPFSSMAITTRSTARAARSAGAAC